MRARGGSPGGLGHGRRVHAVRRGLSDTSTAWEACEALWRSEDGRSMEIEGVILVKREADGKLEVLKATDHAPFTT